MNLKKNEYSTITATYQKSRSVQPAMSPTLLTLPPELRNQILETVFYGAELTTLCKYHRPNLFQRANYGILAANKQLHREASAILFHGAVLRLDIPEMDVWVPRLATNVPDLTTKTVIPVWSWYIRDKYRDSGTDLEFLQRWQGLEKVRFVEMSLPLEDEIGWLAVNPGLGHFIWSCETAAGFVNRLPEVESLTVYTDAGGLPWMEKCKEKLRGLTRAKLMIVAKDDICSCQP